MKLGIDFNQFTHFQLKGILKGLGFSTLWDQFEILDAENMVATTFWKKVLINAAKRFKTVKTIALCFSPGTFFICKKGEIVS